MVERRCGLLAIILHAPCTGGILSYMLYMQDLNREGPLVLLAVKAVDRY